MSTFGRFHHPRGSSPRMSNRIRFGEFEADVATGELRRGGTLVPIQDLPFRLLAALLERPGELVMRGELAARLWGLQTYVDSTAGLNTAVAKLREALGDNPDQPIYVETVPKRGYRFVGWIGAPIAAANDDSDSTPAVSRRRRPLVVAAVSLMTAAVLAFATYHCARTASRCAWP